MTLKIEDCPKAKQYCDRIRQELHDFIQLQRNENQSEFNKLLKTVIARMGALLVELFIVYCDKNLAVKFFKSMLKHVKSSDAFDQIRADVFNLD